MKNYVYFIIALVILTDIVVFWFVLRKNPETLVLPQKNEEGEVTVVVTPVSLQNNGEPITFQITLDTHSRELTEDLMQKTVLRDDWSNEHKPIGWDGDAPGGHHRTGILKFYPLSPFPSTVELILRDIGGVASRKFLWNVASK